MQQLSVERLVSRDQRLVDQFARYRTWDGRQRPEQCGRESEIIPGIAADLSQLLRPGFSPMNDAGPNRRNGQAKMQAASSSRSWVVPSGQSIVFQCDVHFHDHTCSLAKPRLLLSGLGMSESTYQRRIVHRAPVRHVGPLLVVRSCSVAGERDGGHAKPSSA